MTVSVAVLGIGVGSTQPLMALMLTARGLGPEVVGWMAAAVAAGGVAGTFAAPAAARRFGRRRVMLACVALAAASVIVLQAADSLASWALLRAIFGASMAPLFVIGEAWINSLSADGTRGRVVALYTSSFTLCQVAGPLVTEAVIHDPQRAFLVCGGIFLLGLPGIAIARDATQPVVEQPMPHPTKDSGASWWTILRSAPAIVAGAGLFAAFDIVFLTFLPLFVLDRGRTQGRALGAVVIVFAGDGLLQFAAGWLADRFGHARVHRLAGWALCALLPMLPLMIAFPGVWEAYLFLLGGTAGSVYTLAMVSSGQLFSGAALLRASGLIALTWNVAGSLGPAATGIVVQHFGNGAMTAVLWIMSLGLVAATGRAARP